MVAETHVKEVETRAVATPEKRVPYAAVFELELIRFSLVAKQLHEHPRIRPGVAHVSCVHHNLVRDTRDVFVTLLVRAQFSDQPLVTLIRGEPYARVGGLVLYG